MLSLFFMTTMAMASVSELPLTGIETLIVSIDEGDVRILPVAKNSKILRINADDSLQVVQQENHIEVRKKNHIDKNEFAKSKGIKTVEISGGLPVEVHLLSGSISLQGGFHPARLNVQKGKILVRGHEGPLWLHSQKGEASIIGQKGPTDLDFNQVRFQGNKIEGNVELDEFNGEVQLSEVDGVISLNQNQGSARIEKSTGTLRLDLQKGSLRASGFQGRIEGDTQDASLHLDLPIEFDIHLKSNSGKSKFVIPPQSGAYLSLYAESGEIYMPNGYKINRGAEERVYRGRLRGSEKRGRIVVSSQDGSIIVSQ